MKTYTVLMTQNAEADVRSIRDYFLNDMQSPATAAMHLRAIREEVASLRDLPLRYQLLEEEPWHSRGIRSTLARKYLIYYRVDEEKSTVYVLNVVLASRNQLKILEGMNL